MELTVRAVRYDHPDAVALTEQVQRYYVQIYGGPDSEVITPEQLSHPRGGFFVGYVDGQAVAMGGWLFAEDVPVEGDAQIRRMYTSPDARRLGFGRRLLDALEADAAAVGARRLVLSTGRPQTSAIALYRASGYVDIEPFGYYGDKSEVVCLAKPLDRVLDQPLGTRP